MIPTTNNKGESSPRTNRQAVTEASASRAVPRPVPRSQVENVRAYQVEQLKRRYAAKESPARVNNSGDTTLAFGFAPSDPDFPYELDRLECELLVPASYPARPGRLRVRNTDIPRGFAANIEKGWDALVADRPGASLLALTTALDKRLESLLSGQKAETVKLTIFKDTRHLDAVEVASSSDSQGASANAGAATALTTPAPVVERRKAYVPEESFTREQISEARARRAQEVRQLEARMGRLPLYRKSSDGVVYTLPLEPRRRSALPAGLRPVQSVQLIIPLLYPLQPLRVLLNDVESRDAEGIEELFTERASAQRQMTLMSHLNYLAQNIHNLAKEAQGARAEADKKEAAAALAALEIKQSAEVKAGQSKHSASTGITDDKSHIRHIPRPPEWEAGYGSGESASSDGDENWDGDEEGDDNDDEDEDEDADDDEDTEDGGVAIGVGAGAPEPSSQPKSQPQGAERGTAMSFPSLELRGIELLQVAVLALDVKCERCKTLNEVGGLRPGVQKAGSCRKCAARFAVRFRQELVHQHSTRAGFVDCEGCVVADMLPSTFIPTCATCSTPSPGIVSVRGETTTNVCRECHSRFTFKLPEVKFLAYAPGGNTSLLPANRGGRRQEKEKLGLHAGDPLPNRGTCAHYRRSYRWFRFSCCGRVHACDRCHDAAEDHPNEWAPRVICGWCSREQRYSPESCAFCGRSVIGRRGKGYWEGGKGTRSRVLMRRGDKRKYRRVGGGEARKKKDE